MQNPEKKEPDLTHRPRAADHLPPDGRPKQYPPMISQEVIINDIAHRALSCVKLCQEQRPIAKAKKSRPGNLLDLQFAKDFADLLVRLEDTFFQLAPSAKRTAVSMFQDLADMDPDSIPVTVTETEVLIRTPYLPPRNVTKYHLCTELLAARLAITDLPRWTNWHADICQVYPSHMLRYARDVDNSDYKPVIDTLAIYLKTTDAAGHFSMSADAVADDTIPPGTYIRVTEKPSASPAVEAWKKAKKVRNSTP